MAGKGLTLSHAEITVKNLRTMVEFYRDVLGFKELGQIILGDGSHKIVWLATSAGEMIEFFEFRPRKGKDKDPSVPQGDLQQDIGITHIGFQSSPDEFDGIMSQLKRKNVEFTIDPRTADWCALKLAFFKDPEGNLLEVISGKLENITPVRFDD